MNLFYEIYVWGIYGDSYLKPNFCTHYRVYYIHEYLSQRGMKNKTEVT